MRLFSKHLEHAGHTRKASRISNAAVDNFGKGVGNFYLSYQSILVRYMYFCIISNVSRLKFYIREQLYRKSLAIDFSSLPCSGQTAYLYNFRDIKSYIIDKSWCLYCS